MPSHKQGQQGPHLPEKRAARLDCHQHPVTPEEPDQMMPKRNSVTASCSSDPTSSAAMVDNASPRAARLDCHQHPITPEEPDQMMPKRNSVTASCSSDPTSSAAMVDNASPILQSSATTGGLALTKMSADEIIAVNERLRSFMLSEDKEFSSPLFSPVRDPEWGRKVADFLWHYERGCCESYPEGSAISYVCHHGDSDDDL